MLKDLLGPLPLCQHRKRPGLVRHILPPVGVNQEQGRNARFGYTRVLENGSNDSPFPDRRPMPQNGLVVRIGGMWIEDEICVDRISRSFADSPPDTPAPPLPCKRLSRSPWVYAWPQELDHELRCINEQFTKHVEGQNYGQDTAATHRCL